MKRSARGVIAVLLLTTLVVAGAATAVAADSALTAEQLTYTGARVKAQVDVNGEAAVQLVGGMLDAATEIAEKQAAGAPQEGPMAQMAMAAPFMGPARDIIKSLSRMTVLVMATEEGARAEDIMGHYSGLIAGRGWVPMVTVRAESGENVATYLAPGGKGVFAVVRPNGRELVVALITTKQPIGDLLAQIVRTSGSDALPALLAAKARPAPPTAQPQCAVEEPDDDADDDADEPEDESEEP